MTEVKVDSEAVDISKLIGDVGEAAFDQIM